MPIKPVGKEIGKNEQENRTRKKFTRIIKK